tara:strand:+ start:86224 stop:87276 length:1053 start_codon:yes stop_codon:yes gene_type:complete
MSTAISLKFRAAMALVAFLGAAPALFNPVVLNFAKADEQRALAAREIRVNARQIPTFDIRSNETRFGALEYIGGMQINSPDALLGGISAMRLLPDGVRFVGAMDTGYLFTGRLVRDSDGRLSGLSDFVVAPMHGLDGQLVPQRWSADAEGLAIDGDRVLVSFERLHRIEQYRLSDIGEAVPMGTVSQPIPISEFRSNRGMEAIAVAPTDSALAGAIVVVSEKSLNRDGDVFAAIVDGPQKGVFYVRRQAPFDVTDGDFLPNGDLLLLERRFSVAQGVGMRIRRIKAKDIRPGKTVDGAVLVDAGFGFQIDNMESLDVFEAADGSTHVMLASDDNFSILQRSLILEFRLHE